MLLVPGEVGSKKMESQRVAAVLLSFVWLVLGAKERGDVILTGGQNAYAGYLQVHNNKSSFGYVCDDPTSEDNINKLGQVACRNLERAFLSAVARQTINGSDEYALDDVVCAGHETNLDQCSHSPWGTGNCASEKEHVYVTCDTNECRYNNGGCSHICVNNFESHLCECPSYLHMSDDGSTCTDGYTVDCTSSSSGMTMIMDKQKLFFLPDSLTLTDTSCTSKPNSTHVWLYTDYNGCSTTRKIVDGEVIYSNTVIDSNPSVGEVRFFDSIKIPFQCRFSTNSTIIQPIPKVRSLIMRIDSTASLLERNHSIKLLNGESDDSPEVTSHEFRQGNILSAKLPPTVAGLKLIPEYCDVYSQDQAASQRLVANGTASTSFTKILPSDGFRFSYPAFTFSFKRNVSTLHCNSSLDQRHLLNHVNSSLIITEEEIDQAVPNFCYGLSYTQEWYIQVGGENVTVLCDMDTPDGPWIVVFKHTSGSNLFKKQKFAVFEAGFGDVNSDHFIGLKAIHHLTSEHKVTLRVDVEDQSVFAEYGNFKVGDASTDYTLQELSGYRGTAGDMRGSHGTQFDPLGQKFSTTDRDNDRWYSNCADSYEAGWWFNACQYSCLTCEPIYYLPRTRPKVVSMRVRVAATDVPQIKSKAPIEGSVIVNNTHGIKLECGSETMKLEIVSSEMVGLSPEDLVPLKEDCQGFMSRRERVHFIFEIPLLNCGAEVKTTDNEVVFTNSLVYATNLSTNYYKHFSEVILTHSCSYPLNGYISELNYTVRSNNYSFGAVNNQRANFDVRLNIFSDKEFKNLLNKDGLISSKYGRRFFGDIGVESSDPSLKVALQDCTVSPTSNVSNPDSLLVIRNGCKTGYGAKVLSSDKFSLLSTTFLAHRGKITYLHCSVKICDANDMSRCQRQCSDQSANLNVFGRRDVGLSSPKIVSVTAGPFNIQ